MQLAADRSAQILHACNAVWTKVQPYKKAEASFRVLDRKGIKKIVEGDAAGQAKREAILAIRTAIPLATLIVPIAINS